MIERLRLFIDKIVCRFKGHAMRQVAIGPYDDPDCAWECYRCGYLDY